MPKCSLDDLICVWLDQAIPILENLEFLDWSSRREISLPEAARSQLFQAIRQLILDPESGNVSYRKILKFPRTVISRVNNAISHLNKFSIENEMRERTVTFMPTTIPQLAQQIPVALALQDTGRSYSFLFPSSKWAADLDLKTIDVNHHSRSLQNEMLSARLRARVLWLRLGREENVRLPEFCYGGKHHDLSQLVLATLAASLNSIFEAHALSAHLVRTIRSKLLVLGNDLSPYGRTMSACVKPFGIRSVSLLSQVTEAPIDAYRASDRFVVFGNYSKRALSSCGIDNKKIMACGSPYLDQLVAKDGLSFLTRDGSEIGKKSGFIVADLAGKTEQRLKRFAQRFPKHFFLSLANGARKADIEQIPIGKASNFQVRLKQDLSNGKLAECIRAADSILTSRFQSAMELIGIGKRVIAIDFDGEFDNREFLQCEIVEVARDEESLAHIIETTKPSQTEKTSHSQKFFEDYFYRRDGNSSQRIARVLVEECHR